MAKAHITTKDGSTIVIEGTAEEVATLVARFSSQAAGSPAEGSALSGRKGTRKKASPKVNGSSKVKNTATALISEMISNGYFKKPKALGEIMAELKQNGHYFTTSGVSVPLLRAVRKRDLRRIGEGGAWTYVV